jgi:hypothetical protein
MGFVNFLSATYHVKVKGDGIDITKGAGMYKSEKKRNVLVYDKDFPANQVASTINSGVGSGIWKYVDVREVVIGAEEPAPVPTKQLVQPVKRETVTEDGEALPEKCNDGLCGVCAMCIEDDQLARAIPENNEGISTEGASKVDFDGTSNADEDVITGTGQPSGAVIGVVQGQKKTLATPVGRNVPHTREAPLSAPKPALATPVGSVAQARPNPDQRPRSVMQKIEDRKGRL